MDAFTLTEIWNYVCFTSHGAAACVDQAKSQ